MLFSVCMRRKFSTTPWDIFCASSGVLPLPVTAISDVPFVFLISRCFFTQPPGEIFVRSFASCSFSSESLFSGSKSISSMTGFTTARLFMSSMYCVVADELPPPSAASAAAAPPLSADAPRVCTTVVELYSFGRNIEHMNAMSVHTTMIAATGILCDQATRASRPRSMLRSSSFSIVLPFTAKRYLTAYHKRNASHTINHL